MSQGPTKGVPIDTDGSLSANLDTLVPSEKAVKTYVDNHVLTAIAGNTFASYIFPDPNLTVGTSYERITNHQSNALGYVQLKPNPTWTETIANAISSPPGGWTLVNSAKLNSADENVTLANALTLSHVTSSTSNWDAAGTQTSPYYYKVFPNIGKSRRTFIARMATKTLTNNTDALKFMICDDSTISKHVGWYIDGTPQLVATNASASTVVAATLGQCQAGIWFRIDVFQESNTAIYSYNLTNQATPPSTWTVARRDTSAFAQVDDPLRAGFILIRSTGTCDGYVLYYEDDQMDYGWGAAGLGTDPTFNTGFDNTNPAQTLIANFDLGAASATINDTKLQAVLTEAINRRAIDTATWTFSAVRGTSESPAAGSYTSAATTAVAGSGRYFALYAKCSSTGRTQPGSIDLDKIAVPYAAPAVSVGISTKNYIQTDRNLSTGTNYERVNSPTGIGLGLVQLKPHRTFDVTHANAILTTTTVEGWTSRNTSNITAANTNSTTANALYIQHNTSATDDLWSGVDSCSSFDRTHDGAFTGYEAICRTSVAFTQDGIVFILNLQENTPSNNWGQLVIDNSNIGTAWSINGAATGGASFAINGTQKTNGIWLRLVRSGPDMAFFYSVANQATPPTTWTLLDKKAGVFSTSGIGGATPMRIELRMKRWNTTPTTNTNCSVLYFDEAFVPSPFATTYNTDAIIGAIGFDSSNPAITLVSSFDLGTPSAVISDTQLQATLTEVINPRSTDTGTWAFSAVRSNSANPAAVSYQSAATCSVSGTGQYFALYAYCTSTGRLQAGSLDTARLLIPYTGSSGAGGTVSNSTVGTINTIPIWDGGNTLSNSHISESVSGPNFTYNFIQSTVGGTNLALTNGNGAVVTLKLNATGTIGTTTNNGLTLYVNTSTNAIQITAAGLVGIMKAPSYDLDVSGTVAAGFYYINIPTLNGFNTTGGCSFTTSSVATNNTTLNYPSPYMAQIASVWDGAAAVGKAFVWSVGQVSGTNSAYALQYDSTDKNNIFAIRGDSGLVSIKYNAGTLPAVPAAGTLLQIAGADTNVTRALVDSFGAANAFSGRRANGTNASKTGVVANDVLCQLTGTGYNSAAAYGAVCGDVRVLASETHSGTAMGSGLSFRTTANTTLTLAEKMSLSSEGVLSVTGGASITGGSTFTLNVAAGSVVIAGNTADSVTSMGIKGSARGIRMGTTATDAIISGTDQTLSGSYQSLLLNGSTLGLQISGTTKYSISTTARHTFTGTVEIGGTLVDTTLGVLHVGAGSDVPTLSGYISSYLAGNGSTINIVRNCTDNVEGFMLAYTNTVYTGTSTNHPLVIRTNNTAAMTFSAAQQIQINTAPAAFAAGDKYLVIDASGNIHKSALGPAS